jgi:hypothetical protein
MRTNTAWENFSGRPVGLVIFPQWKRIAKLCIVVFVFIGRAHGQSPSTITDISPKQVGRPVLQITSPANRSIVNPGRAVSVSVTSPANASFAQVAVIGEDPIGFSSIQTSVPAMFSFTIPTDLACREYALTALGITASGQTVESNPLTIDIERPDLPVSISVQTQNIIFSNPGETSPILLLATFSDGSILDVTESSNVAYSSTNTSVAVVDAHGIVTSVAPGEPSVTATYTQNGHSVQTTIAITVPPYALNPSVPSLSFGNQNVGTSSPTQQVTLTNATNGPMEIVSLSTTGDFSKTDNCTSSSPLSVKGTCTVNVTFTPTRSGLRNGSVSIYNSFAVSPLLIPMTGSGN